MRATNDSVAGYTTANVLEQLKSDGNVIGHVRAAFKGPDYSYDETKYLSSDGDHPNAAGHQQIAAATEAVIEKSL